MRTQNGIICIPIQTLYISLACLGKVYTHYKCAQLMCLFVSCNAIKLPIACLHIMYARKVCVSVKFDYVMLLLLVVVSISQGCWNSFDLCREAL